MTTPRTPEQWAEIGRTLGRERGMLDLLAREVKPVDQLWIPAGADPAYVEALHQGYLDTVASAERPPEMGP